MIFLKRIGKYLFWGSKQSVFRAICLVILVIIVKGVCSRLLSLIQLGWSMLGLDFAVDKLTRVSWQQKRSHFKLLSPIA